MYSFVAQKLFATTNRLGLESSFAEIGKFGVILRQVGIALELDLSLVGSLACRSSFSVSSVKAIHNVHAFNDFPNRTKALIIQKGIALLASIDKDLGSTTIGSSRGKDDCSSCVGNLDGVILENLSTPLGLQGRISRNAKLRNKARNDTKDAAVVPKSSLG